MSSLALHVGHIGRSALVAIALVVATSCGRGAKPAASPGSGSGLAGDVAVLPDPLQGRRWLERDANVATALGAGPLKVVLADVGADGDRLGSFVAIPNDQCLLAYARGSFGIDDLDLYAYADDGTTLAADEAADPHPAVVVCPPHPARAYVVARVAAGRGVVSIGAHSVATGAVSAVGKALSARGSPGEEMGRVEAWPGLEEKIGAHRRETGVPWEEIRRVAVQVDARAPTRVSALLEAGRCMDILVVPGDELAQLDVTLLDGDGRLVARAEALGRDRVGVLCSPIQTPVSIEMRPHAGQGLCAIALARSVPGTDTQIAEDAVQVHRIAPSFDVAIARAQRAKVLHAAGYGEATQVAAGTAEVGRRVSFPIELPDGCARLDVVAGKPLAGVAADLWDSAGALLASASSFDGPALFVCGKGARARIDVEATTRAGPMAVEIRKERAAPASLLSHPLAASRLLADLNARGYLPGAAASDARIVAMDATSLKSLDLAIPEGRCGEVVAALGPGGSGVDLRVVDRDSGQEHALVRGPTIASTNVCAVGGPRQIRAELRLAAGKTEALVSARLVPLAAR